MQSRWQIVTDPGAGADARTEAWRALRERVRRPVLFQLRRRVEGWRLTDELADEVCERIFERYAGSGDGSLRECVAGEVRRMLEERHVTAEVDDEFERDWASSLFAAALKELRRQDPQGYAILVRLYDRPEGAAPLTPPQLADKLDLLASDVEHHAEQGRAELEELFRVEIGHTVADPDLAEAEAEHLLPRAQALFDG